MLLMIFLKRIKMEATTIKQVKKGDYFRFKDDENAPIWVRSDYNRSTKKYECYKYEDVNHFLECKGERKVYLL